MIKYNIVSKDTPLALSIKKQLKDKLKGKLIESDTNFSICITIGGDGTFLYAINKYIDKLDTISFVGIHAGTLGFYTDYTKDELDLLVNHLLKSQPNYEIFNLLQCNTNKDIYYAVNDIRIESIIKTILIDVSINDNKLERFRGNGLLVCSHLGSTAYNRSLNGAIIDHKLRCLQLTEISPINRQHYPTCGSSIVFDINTIIKLEGNFSNALLVCDSFSYDLSNINQVIIRNSNKTIKLLRNKKISYLERIKTLF